MAKGGVAIGLEITELRLGLPGGNTDKKRLFSEMESNNEEWLGERSKKVQVVGWPPVCSYRKKNNNVSSKMYVKVSMDGAPILRKIDLDNYKEYGDLAMALEKLFDWVGKGDQSLNDDEDENNNSEYVSIYEDKDGDWMLVGDVPWEMFSESCKRLRIMKRSEAKGEGLMGACRDFLKGISSKDG